MHTLYNTNDDRAHRERYDLNQDYINILQINIEGLIRATHTYLEIISEDHYIQCVYIKKYIQSIS